MRESRQSKLTRSWKATEETGSTKLQTRSILRCARVGNLPILSKRVRALPLKSMCLTPEPLDCQSPAPRIIAIEFLPTNAYVKRRHVFRHYYLLKAQASTWHYTLQNSTYPLLMLLTRWKGNLGGKLYSPSQQREWKDQNASSRRPLLKQTPL